MPSYERVKEMNKKCEENGGLEDVKIEEHDEDD